MTRHAQHLVLPLLLAVLLLTGRVAAEDFEPLDDTISARFGGVLTGVDRDLGVSHVRESAWSAWLRLQFGAKFGEVAHVSPAWEPRLGVMKSSADAEGTVTGISPFEILGGAWLKLGKNRGMIRSGYYWDYGSYLLSRARFDWGGGALEGSFSFGHSLRASLAYRLRLSTHLVLMPELRGERTTYDLSYSRPTDGPQTSRSRSVSGYGGESLLSLEWALDGE